MSAGKALLRPQSHEAQCRSAGTAVNQVRSGEVQQTANTVAEKGKEYGAKGWGLLRGIAATVATQVENVASEHGYKVDLGEDSDFELA